MGRLRMPGRLVVVPTPVGVNRPLERYQSTHGARCPHTRGGEPGEESEGSQKREGCPHTRGGEPVRKVTKAMTTNSCPHTRGGEPQGKAVLVTASRGCPHTRGGEPAYRLKARLAT